VPKILKKSQFAHLWYATLLLIVVLASGLYSAYFCVTAAVEKEASANLDIATEQFAVDVQNYFELQKIQMQAMADLVAQLPDIRDKKRVQDLLRAFNKDKPARHTRVVYPDNTTIRDTGESSNFSFTAENRPEPYVTDDKLSDTYKGRKVVRVLAPVVKDGKTAALVCNTVYLDDMRDFFKVDIYKGRAQLFIVDGTTGHYLLDNWHDNLNNNIAMLTEREYHSGYSGESFVNDLKKGRPGRTIFKSQSVGKYLYTHYRPVGINNWQAVVSVLEPDAMALAHTTTNFMASMALVYLLAFGLFLGWVFYLRRLNLKEWERLWRMDLNTGLENRNAYIQLLHDFELIPGQILACIYVDVNGLHELNNRSGHEAGDQMLNAVAEVLQEAFPAAYLYRLGGDEFLVVAVGMTEAVALAKLQMIKAELGEQQYFISAGVEFDDRGRPLEEVVSAADKKMLADKREYYSTVGDRRHR
jgi:diguanylate cyclase (GGDEF)-like protein